MTSAEPFETTFEQSLRKANQVASRLLRSQQGAHTSEDVVSWLIEKELRSGKSLPEIQEILSGPGMYKRLANIKNDIFRWETAIKRGGGQPTVSFENVELFLGTTTDDPESELIRKEDFAHMKDLLTQLLKKVKLSETQLEILNLDQRGLPSKRIAHELRIGIDVVYARRSEALRKLAAAARHFYKNKK